MKNIKLNHNNLELSCDIFEVENPKGIIQVIHGMCEHKIRYYKLAEFLNTLGYVVCLNDMRGHAESSNENYPLGYFGKKGEDTLVLDQAYISKYLIDTYKLPLNIFAHSMGTIIARVYLQKYANLVDKVILSGTPNYQPIMPIGILLAQTISLFKGSKSHSKLLDNMVIGSFNKIVENPQTNSDWLSYNKDNVTTYNNDPLCGFSFTINGYITLFKLLKKSHNKKKYLKNDNLKILFISGVDDPCTGGMKGLNSSIDTLAYTYKNIKNITFTGMRHEILNEVNYHLVFEEIKQFI